MRIIAGKHKGRRLRTPKDDTVIRPTTDFTREALFNLLQRRIMGAVVLDLFAGTGAVTLESLSRGAAHAVACDASKESIALVTQNASDMGETPEILRGDYIVCCARLDGRKFDIIFLDPPYQMDIAPVLRAIAQYALCATDGLVVYEHDSGTVLPNVENWERVDQRKYGRVTLSFLQRKVTQ